MKETIGKISLDYAYYPGEDLYSDGAVEDELLSIAKEYEESQWNQVIAERKSWPILYHFSHVRQNIVSWLPISGEDRVLEIGSGCGAITGALAEKAASVTCVELSRKRSHINAYRNQNCDNVEILVGNFQDIEKTIGTYDVITLIGVFEYSNGYIGGDQPFVDMLRTIRKHLAPGGRLVIAIENRLGLKYWAGCTEDHTGTWFEGLEDYPKTTSVHTFSYKEMQQLVKEAGGFGCRMYYPYPDYKFPMQIFSDERLPKEGELKELRYNFDRSRMVLFDEIKVMDSLIRNDLFPTYSNSFLLVLTEGEVSESEEHCIYAKYSNERATAFSTRTEIWKNKEGEKEVRKLSVSPGSEKFVTDIYSNYQKLQSIYQSAGVQMNRCEPCEKGVKLAFCEGISLEEELDQMLLKGKTGEIHTLIKSLAAIFRDAASQPFRMTEEFRTVFGEAAFEREMLCPAVCNIDPVCSNLIRRDKGWEMLDYEWSFSFPVPADYQIFRLLHYYLYSSTARDVLQRENLFGSVGITEDEIKTFEEMEKHFQQYIQAGRVPMRDMYEEISPGICFDQKSLAAIQREQDARKIQVYVDYGEDFSEENSWHINMENGEFNGVIDLPENTVRLRIDPCEENCVVELREYALTDNTQDLALPVICTGKALYEQAFYFTDADPYFLIDVPEGQKQLKLSMKVHYLGKGGMHPIGKLLEQHAEMQAKMQTEISVLSNQTQELSRKVQTDALKMDSLKLENEALKAELAWMKEKIKQMENTKVWKAYSRIKGKK